MGRNHVKKDTEVTLMRKTSCARFMFILLSMHITCIYTHTCVHSPTQTQILPSGYNHAHSEAWILTVWITHTELGSIASELGDCWNWLFNSRKSEKLSRKSELILLQKQIHQSQEKTGCTRQCSLGNQLNVTDPLFTRDPSSRSMQEERRLWGHAVPDTSTWKWGPDGLQTARDAGLMFWHRHCTLLIRSTALNNVLNNYPGQVYACAGVDYRFFCCLGENFL